MMNKRGSEDTLFFTIWELLAFAMVLVIILISVRGVAINNTYWKTYYSRDLGMIADLANINQGDFVINYNLKNNMNNFLTQMYFLEEKYYDIVLTNKSFQVYDHPKEQSKYPTVFPFAKHKRIKVSEDSTSSNFLVIIKKGDIFKINDYFVEDAEVCPSYSTTKDTALTKFYSIHLDPKVKQHSESIGTLLGIGRYGNDQNAKRELTILVGYANEFSVYYSTDSNTLKSQKLSCIFKMRFLDNYNYTAEIKKYDGSFDSNPEFTKYVSGKEPQEYWIIITLSNNETKIPQNEFASIVEKSIKEFYE